MVYRLTQRRLYTVPEGSTVVVLEAEEEYGLVPGDVGVVADGPSGRVLVVDGDALEVSGNLLVRLADEESIQRQEDQESSQAQPEVTPSQETEVPLPPRRPSKIGIGARALQRAAGATFREVRPIAKGTARLAGRAALGGLRAAEAVVGFRVMVGYVTPGSTVQALEDDTRSDIVAGDIGVVRAISGGGRSIYFPDTRENLVPSQRLPVMVLESRPKRGRLPLAEPRVTESEPSRPSPTVTRPRMTQPYRPKVPTTQPRSYLTKAELIELISSRPTERPASVVMQTERPRGVPDAPPSFRPTVRRSDDFLPSIEIPSIEISGL